MENNLENAISKLVQIGRNDREIKPVDLSEIGPGTRFAACIPDGMHIVELTAPIDTAPRWKRDTRSFIDVESFIQYVNEQKDDFSRIFAQITEPPFRFDAIIDFHETSGGSAGRCQHQAILKMAFSENFKTWQSINGKLMEQSDFAEFLKDNRGDIITPDNASILQIVMELEATSSARCTGRVQTNAGMAFAFSEEIQTSVGGTQITVPEQITLKIPVFEGLAFEEIKCDFKFRTSNGKLAFGIRMIGVERMIRNAVMAARERIHEQCNLPVYL